METVATSLLIAIPGFVILMLLERLVGWKMGRDIYANIPDVISSLSSGIANIMKGALGLVLVLVPYEWMVQKVAFFEIDPTSVTAWVVAILCIDFSSYWAHRWNHQWNTLWQFHLIHHSSEEFNLPCALRQPTNNFINYHTFMWIPAAFIGVPAEMMVVIGLVHLYYQYWYHTQLIGDLGILEKFIMTPRLHAVHHAMNKEYVDKNYSAWFCIWDRLFGTYQQPIEGVPPVFGVSMPVRTWNPIKIDFMHWWNMLKDMAQTVSIADKFKMLFSRTNWRPEDVSELSPRSKVSNPYEYEKFSPTISNWLVHWCALELALSGLLVMCFFYLFGTYETAVIYGFVFFMFFNIITYTSLMEGRAVYLLLTMRLLTCLGVLYVSNGSWFGMEAVIGFLPEFLVVFYGGSLLVTRVLVESKPEYTGVLTQ